MAHVTKNFERTDSVKKISKNDIALLDNRDRIPIMRNRIKIEPIPLPEDDFVQVLQCGDNTLLYYFENSDGNGLRAAVNSKFIFSHLKIPLQFERVIIERREVNNPGSDTNKFEFSVKEFQEIKGVKMDFSSRRYPYSGYFALNINREDILNPIVDLQHSGSRFGCGTTPNNFLGNNNNLDQSIFKYKSFYMIPIIMETGISLYHRFPADDEKLGEILDEVINRKQYKVGFDSKVSFHKTLGVYYVSKAVYQ